MIYNLQTFIIKRYLTIPINFGRDCNFLVHSEDSVSSLKYKVWLLFGVIESEVNHFFLVTLRSFSSREVGGCDLGWLNLKSKNKIKCSMRRFNFEGYFEVIEYESKNNFKPHLPQPVRQEFTFYPQILTWCLTGWGRWGLKLFLAISQAVRQHFYCGGGGGGGKHWLIKI